MTSVSLRLKRYMNKLLAIVSLSYKESIRKKIFLVIIVFALLLIIFSSFMPVVKPADRIRLVEIWSLQGISFLGILMAIFLAAVSLPDDIEMKRLLLILPKPISRETLIIGKFLGFVLTLGMFVLIMGLVSLIYLYITAGINKSMDTLVVRQEIQAAEMHFQTSPAAAQTAAASEPDKITGNYHNKEGVSVTLEGNKNNLVAWRFADLPRTSLPTKAKIILLVGEGMKVSAAVNVRVVNPTTKEKMSQNVLLSYKQPELIDFPASLVDQTGELRIYVQRIDPASYVTAAPTGVVLLSGPSNFAWNFSKALALIWMQIMLILAFCIAGSTFLSAGINVFFNIVIYGVGSGIRFWESSLEMMQKTMNQLIKDEALLAARQLAHQPPPDTLPLWMMQASDFITRWVLKIFPDFSRYDGTDYLISGYTVNSLIFPGLFGYLLFYALIAFVIGTVAFRLREVK